MEHTSQGFAVTGKHTDAYTRRYLDRNSNLRYECSSGSRIRGLVFDFAPMKSKMLMDVVDKNDTDMMTFRVDLLYKFYFGNRICGRTGGVSLLSARQPE